MMKKAFALTAAAIFAGSMMFACSSSSNAASSAANGDCPAVGSKVCSADDAVTQDDVNSCNTEKSDATCGSKYVDLLKCEGSNAKCGSDNKLDTAGLLQACSSQINAYSACKQGGSGDGG